MKNLLLVIGLAFSLDTVADQSDDPCPEFDLSIPSSEAEPLVKVSPKYPSHGDRAFPGCVIVSFELEEKPGSEGKALIPKNIRVEATSSKIWNRTSVRAVSKWMYLSKNVEYRGRQLVKLTYQLGRP